MEHLAEAVAAVRGVSRSFPVASMQMRFDYEKCMTYQVLLQDLQGSSLNPINRIHAEEHVNLRRKDATVTILQEMGIVRALFSFVYHFVLVDCRRESTFS